MLTMESLLGASFGEVSSEIDVTVKKTINIRQYENEAMEINCKLKMEETLSSGERLFITEVLAAQIEYAIYSNLFTKKLVTDTEFKARKSELEGVVNAVKIKVENESGKSLDRFITQKIE